MESTLDFYRSTVGKKVVMAVTGSVLIGFVIMHMIGNLKIFAGVDPASGVYKFDHYAVFLREIGQDLFGPKTLLWAARIVLIVCVVLHAVSGIQLARLNRKAKPVDNRAQKYRSANAASRTMFFGGIFLAAFIIYHLLHFTFGTAHFNGFVHGRVYSNVVRGFQNPGIAGMYVLAMGLLALHLYHGTWSMFQTLGVDSPSWNRGIRSAAKLVAIVLFIGFSVVPAAVTLGLLPEPTQLAVPGGH